MKTFVGTDKQAIAVELILSSEKTFFAMHAAKKKLPKNRLIS